jgi:hypothetical protein
VTEDMTKLCENCRGKGTDDSECRPRFAGDVDSRDVPFAAPTPKCSTCGGSGRVPLGRR